MSYYRSLIQNQQINNTGLIVHLDAGNINSYSSGIQWRDISGNNNHFTLINDIVLDSEKGGCFNLNNVKYAKGGNSILNGKTTCTLMMWARRLGSSSIVNFGAFNSVEANTNRAEIVWYNDNYFYGEVGINGDKWVKTYLANQLDWHLLAMTYDGTLSSNKIKLYVDGVLYPIAFGNGTISNFITASSDMLIGKRDFSTASFSKYAVIRVFDIVKTPTEMLEFYNFEKTRFL